MIMDSRKELLVQAALLAYSSGVSVFPPTQNGTKRPDGKWSQYQKKPASAIQINAWYAQTRTGIGVICGDVSQGLEAIDFDDRSIMQEFFKLCKDAGLGQLIDRIKNGYFEHSPNGAHLLYRCSEIEGNQKLAKAKDKKSLIETRGEGGYLITAPSYGSVNLSGTYDMVSGGFNTIETITPEEREELFGIARLLDETIEPDETQTRHFGGNGDISRPGDDFNHRVPWTDILPKYGWVKVFSRLNVISWRRPGKKIGISATTNYAGSDLFYVFSTSTDFEAERGYSKFSAYSLLEHNGDHKAAARQLRNLGYGQQVETPPNIADFVSKMDPSKKSAPTAKKVERMPEHLLKVPGLIGELTDWINRTSLKPQPILALGASIAALSTIIGRRVRTETNLRSNIYILGVGETGCGKEWPRQAIRSLFIRAGAGKKTMVDDLASDTAIMTALHESPSSLFLMDEIGRFLTALSKDHAPVFLTNIIGQFLKIYGAAAGPLYGKSYADRDKSVVIEQPCLSIYGTTVPDNLYGSITRAQIADGFLSRLLIFESEDPDPEFRRIALAEEEEPPDRLVDAFYKWHRKPINVNPNAGNIEGRKVSKPFVVKSSSGARQVFDDLESDLRKKRESMRKKGKDPGIYTRVSTAAQKLALIRASGLSFTPEIGEQDAEWGAELANWLTERFLKRIEDNVSENNYEARLKRVLGIITDFGTEGITQHKLSRKTQWLKRHERQDILDNLIEGGYAQKLVTQPTGKTKKPITKYLAT